MNMVKQAIVLQDFVYVTDHNDYKKMLNELGIKDTRQNRENQFVCIKLYPTDGNPYTPVEDWILKVDQGVCPNWFFKAMETHKIKNAIGKWAKSRIFIGVDNLFLKQGSGYYLKDCKHITLSGTANVTYLDDSQVDIMEGESVIEVTSNSKIFRMLDYSRINELNNKNWIKDMSGHSKIINMSGFAVVDNMRHFSKIVKIEGPSRVGYMYGNSAVVIMKGDSVVENMEDSSKVSKMRGKSMIYCMNDLSEVRDMTDFSRVLNVDGESRVDKMKDESVITILGNKSCKVNIKGISLYGHAYIRDNRTNTIYQNGAYEIVVKNNKK